MSTFIIISVATREGVNVKKTPHFQANMVDIACIYNTYLPHISIKS